MTASRILILMLAFVPICSAEPHSQAATATNGQSIRVNGFEMYYEIHGTGEPLVLLHGFFTSSDTWAEVIPDVKKDYRVIVPDLRGHGRSTNPSKEFTHRQSALDVYALLDELGVHRFRSMGISSGGMTLLCPSPSGRGGGSRRELCYARRWWRLYGRSRLDGGRNGDSFRSPSLPAKPFRCARRRDS